MTKTIYRVFYIDMDGVKDREDLMNQIHRELPLPEECGRNLDALHDVLTEYGDDWNIIFYHCSRIAPALEDYFSRLRRMCDAAADETGLLVRFYR